MSDRTRYLQALLAEIRILIRAIAGDSEKSLSKLSFPWREAPDPAAANAPLPETRQLTYPDIVPWLVAADRIANAPTADGPGAVRQQDDDEILKCTARLQYLRDALIALTKPSTGLSIAYTALAAGNERGSRNENGEQIESSVLLAKMAYPNLERTARFHRYLIYLLCVTAVLLAFFASWQASKASLGKNLLQPLEQLRQQQQAIANEKVKLDARLELEFTKQRETRAPSGQNGGTTPERTYPDGFSLLAQLPPAFKRPDLEMRFHFSAEIRDVCERDSVLGKNIARSQDQLEQFQAYWPGMVGGLYLFTARMIDTVRGLPQLLGVPLPPVPQRPTEQATTCDNPPQCPGARETNGTQPSPCSPKCPSKDVELSVAPVISVITNFVLPVAMGVIGSLLYVILEHYTRLRSNQLMPRDFALSILRVILGIVVAICISLLITGWSTPATQNALAVNGSVPPGSIVGSLALSASLITFLAGFGAEAVFTLLQALVLRIFNPPKEEKG